MTSPMKLPAACSVSIENAPVNNREVFSVEMSLGSEDLRHE
jgi:hypothetical protein